MAHRHINVIIIAAFAVVLLLYAATAHAEMTIGLKASAKNVEGTVQIERGAGGEWQELKTGDKMAAESTIKTGAGSKCVIGWGFGNVVELGPDSELTISQLEVRPESGAEISSLYLLKGKVFAGGGQSDKIFSRFNIRTSSALTEADEAVFSVEATTDDTAVITVFEGAVEVSGRIGGRVTLNRRETTRVKMGRYPDAKTTIDYLTAEKNLPVGIGAPELKLFEPIGDVTVDVPYMNIQGSASPGSTVTVNGSPVDMGQDGAFDSPVELSQGTNKIVIDAAGAGGTRTTKIRNVVYERYIDDSAPGTPAGAGLLSLVTPPYGTATQKSFVDVAGYTIPGAHVSVNGVGVALKPGDRYFTKTVALSPGENRIHVAAEYHGKKESATIKIYREPGSPKLIVTSPSKRFDDSSGVCSISGTTFYCTVTGKTDPGAVLTINNERVDVMDDGSFSHTISLDHTETRIIVTARDADGAESFEILDRVIDPERVAFVIVTVSPASIVADNVSTASVTVTALNLLSEPVDGVGVTLVSTSGGYLTGTTLTASGGTVSTTFHAGIGSVVNPVTITATSMGISGSAILTLLPDAPPLFDY